MDLQKHNQSDLSLPDDTLLVKVPMDLYQKWYDFAIHWNRMDTPIYERQESMYNLLMEWVRDEYLGYGVIAFEDLSDEEAQRISRKINRTITWGMYVLLQKGGSMQPISITDKLLEL